MFFSFSSSAKGQTTQTTPLIEARQEQTREFQTQLLELLEKEFSNSDNKSNHHHLVHTTLTAKMRIHTRKHACATVQQLLCHANHCDPSCNLSSAKETVSVHASPCRS